MSKIIAINAGSSSLKWKLYEMPEEKEIASGLVERVGLKDTVFIINHQGRRTEESMMINNHEHAIELLLEKIIELNIIDDLNEIEGIGHRVVAGGSIFKGSVRVTDKVMEDIESLFELAPLHNPPNLIGIKAFKKVLPDVTSVAVFDTSFHQTIPPENYLYSLPYDYYEKYQVRKYGAHGTSHHYVAQRAGELLNKDYRDLKIITLHLGSGASITAVKNGKSLDTSMGFTPLGGVTMGTRTGDLDSSIIPYLMTKLDLWDVRELVNIFNNDSGLRGISGVSSDMRDIETAAAIGNERAALAIKIFEDRVRNYIGQYIVKMQGVDAIVFTAGIGENSPEIRANIIKNLDFMGIKLDPDKNSVRGEEAIISADDSRASILLIPTEEELMIAREVERLKEE